MFFFCTDEGELVQKTIGDSVTISCRIDVEDQNSLNIKRGLLETDDVFSTDGKQCIISNEVKSRLDFQIQAYPSVDITINNLTIEDRGTYWCIYMKTGQKRENNKGRGSMHLVVNGEQITY